MFVDCVAFDFSVFCIIYIAVAPPLKDSSLNVTVNISPRCRPETKRPLQNARKDEPKGQDELMHGLGWKTGQKDSCTKVPVGKRARGSSFLSFSIS